MNKNPIISRILLNEKIQNLQPKLNAKDEYFACYVQTTNGVKLPALFTDTQIKKALYRARQNKEDIALIYSPDEAQRIQEWLDDNLLDLEDLEGLTK